MQKSDGFELRSPILHKRFQSKACYLYRCTDLPLHADGRPMHAGDLSYLDSPLDCGGKQHGLAVSDTPSACYVWAGISPVNARAKLGPCGLVWVSHFSSPGSLEDWRGTCHFNSWCH